MRCGPAPVRAVQNGDVFLGYNTNYLYCNVGVMRCGPAPVRAVQNGDVFLGYNTNYLTDCRCDEVWPCPC